jgi:aryl-alcohol dehydrogenase-like predicted oxidoreductase
MQYRRLGHSGLMVSELTLGTMNFGGPTDEAASTLMIDKAMDYGINFFDCANVYAEGRSEEILGKVLKQKRTRHETIVSSKAFFPISDQPNSGGNTRHNLINSCHSSLRRLKTDYIDIFFLHRTDWNVPQEETLSALNYLVESGCVRYTACSTHPAWRVVEALHIADRRGFPKFICEQPPYNLLDRRIENEIVPMCHANDMGIATWSPLSQGMLAGRYKSEKTLPKGSRAKQKQIYADRITEAGIRISQDVMIWAKDRNLSHTALCVSWILHQPAITSVIIGPRTIGHLDDLSRSTDIRLSSEDLAWFDTLVSPGTYVSDHFNTSGWQPPNLIRKLSH